MHADLVGAVMRNEVLVPLDTLTKLTIGKQCDNQDFLHIEVFVVSRNGDLKSFSSTTLCSTPATAKVDTQAKRRAEGEATSKGEPNSTQNFCDKSCNWGCYTDLGIPGGYLGDIFEGTYYL